MKRELNMEFDPYRYITMNHPKFKKETKRLNAKNLFKLMVALATEQSYFEKHLIYENLTEEEFEKYIEKYAWQYIDYRLKEVYIQDLHINLMEKREKFIKKK